MEGLDVLEYLECFSSQASKEQIIEAIPALIPSKDFLKKVVLKQMYRSLELQHSAIATEHKVCCGQVVKVVASDFRNPWFKS